MLGAAITAVVILMGLTIYRVEQLGDRVEAADKAYKEQVYTVHCFSGGNTIFHDTGTREVQPPYHNFWTFKQENGNVVKLTGDCVVTAVKVIEGE